MERKSGFKNRKSLKKAAILFAFSLIPMGLKAQEEPPPPPPPIAVEMEPPQITSCWTNSQQPPEFIGGQTAMFRFLSNNIRTSTDSTGICGTVHVGFVVDTDGTIFDVVIKSGINKGFNDEVVRVVKLMSGKWKAGRQQGRAVRVAYTLPIRIHFE